MAEHVLIAANQMMKLAWYAVSRKPARSGGRASRPIPVPGTAKVLGMTSQAEQAQQRV